MSNDDTDEAGDGPIAVLADYDHSRTDYHGEDIDKEEEVCKASRYYEGNCVLVRAKANKDQGVADQAVVQESGVEDLCPRRYVLCR